MRPFWKSGTLGAMGYTVEKEARVVQVTVYRNVRCDKCDKELPASNMTRETTLQYNNALILKFEGGYGMFTDPDNWGRNSSDYNPETDKILCHECAHELAEWLGLDARKWHTHVPASMGGTQHADHHHDTP